METSPTKEDYKKFRRHLDGLSDRAIADRRYQADWGNYDPTDPRNSSWKVRAANRELTARKAKRDRKIQWIAIGAAFLQLGLPSSLPHWQSPWKRVAVFTV